MGEDDGGGGRLRGEGVVLRVGERVRGRQGEGERVRERKGEGVRARVT